MTEHCYVCDKDVVQGLCDCICRHCGWLIDKNGQCEPGCEGNPAAQEDQGFVGDIVVIASVEEPFFGSVQEVPAVYAEAQVTGWFVRTPMHDYFGPMQKGKAVETAQWFIDSRSAYLTRASEYKASQRGSWHDVDVQLAWNWADDHAA